MDAMIAAALVGVLGGLVSAGVVVAWWRRAMGVDDDVVELSATVARLQNTVRRIEMQRVRASAPPAVSTPTGFQPSPSVAETKAALRRRVFGTVRLPDVSAKQGVEVSS